VNDIFFFVIIYDNSLVAIAKANNADSVLVQDDYAIDVFDEDTIHWLLPELERLLHENNVSTMFFSFEMLGTNVIGDVKNDYAVSVDVNLLVAHYKLFDPVDSVSLDE